MMARAIGYIPGVSVPTWGVDILHAGTPRMMAKPKRDEDVVAVKVSVSAHRIAKEAAKIQGITLVEFLTRAATEVGSGIIAKEEARLKAIRDRGETEDQGKEA